MSLTWVRVTTLLGLKPWVRRTNGRNSCPSEKNLDASYLAGLFLQWRHWNGQFQGCFHRPIFNIHLVPGESYAKEPVFSTVYKGAVENSSNAYICPLKDYICGCMCIPTDLPAPSLTAGSWKVRVWVKQDEWLKMFLRFQISTFALILHSNIQPLG